MLTTPAKTATTTATITNSPTITMPTTATTATKTSSTTTTNLPPITTTPTTTNTPTTTTTPTTTNTPTTTTTTPTPTTTTPTTTTSPTTTTMPTTTTSPTTTTASTTTTTMTKITLPTPASTKLSNAQVTTAQPTCSDQSAKCNDHFFTSFLCANLDPINLEYAIATCPMSCNRCTEYYATTPVPITATTVLGTTTPLECIDRETKCSDTFYQTILCTATDQNSKDYALQTCPKACNLCDKLLGVNVRERYLYTFSVMNKWFCISLRCLSCQGVIEPRACLHKQECDVGEICYTEQVIDDDLTKYYNVGCRSTQLCDMAKIAFGRRSGELQVCQKCCHTDKCNNQECQSSQGASTNICSKCQDVPSPLECQSVVECRSDEICFSQQFVNDNFEKRYNLGCEKKKRCELLRQLTPHHRNLQLCNKCCQGSECNKKLCIGESALEEGFKQKYRR
ncbi:unnamed protein product [Mytilus edulis]|uniref:ShKT domain-containing protein n=1 Tax=Mytilus edulis TaxID=6550 RepID=A0A8S3SKR7_MYTED|nr:unnamed protein product [Mytilus edulis]